MLNTIQMLTIFDYSLAYFKKILLDYPNPYFFRDICNGLSGGDSTDCSCLIVFFEFFRFDDNRFIGLGDILDSKFWLSELLNHPVLEASFADARTRFINCMECELNV